MRLSIAGGGSDYPEYFKEHGGAVLTSTINKYCYLNVRYLPPFFEHKYRIVYSKIELPSQIEDIEHPSVRECLRFMNIDGGIEITHAGDIPAKSGLGTSSAFTVGLLHALHALKGQFINKYDLALEAIHVEQDLIKERIGCQDQLSAAIGGFNYIKLGNHKPHVTPVYLTEERVKELESCLLFVFTGFQHMANEITKTYEFEKKKDDLKEISALTDDAYKILIGGDLRDLGKVFHEQWQRKKSLSDKISTPYIDYLYDEAKKQGVIGGRLCGSGNGGFLLMLCESDKQIPLMNSKAFKGLLFVPLKFEHGENVGSRVVSANGEN